MGRFTGSLGHWCFRSRRSVASCFFGGLVSIPNGDGCNGGTGLAGAIIAASVGIMAAGPTRAPALPNAFNAWNGAFQRAALIPYLFWTFAFAYGLRRS